AGRRGAARHRVGIDRHQHRRQSGPDRIEARTGPEMVRILRTAVEPGAPAALRSAVTQRRTGRTRPDRRDAGRQLPRAPHAGADAVLIFRYAASNRAFTLAQAIGITPPRPDGQALTISGDGNALGRAADGGQALEIADLDAEASYPMRDATLAADFHSVLIVP